MIEPTFPVIKKAIGFYPLVNSASEVQRLAELGCHSIQLRIKNMAENLLANEIKRAVQIANARQVNLFINDHWQLALQHQAPGVHLGQEDLEKADVKALRQAGLYLGISCHSYWEVARAHALRPSYIAYGPIFTTTSKKVSAAPQGLQQLKYWCQLLDYPVVAIGGITLQHLSAIMACGVSGVAGISAVDDAAEMIAQSKQYLEL